MAESSAIPALTPRSGTVRSVASVTQEVSSDHVYDIPTKLIKTPSDMKIWEKSEAYFEYLGFILAINESIKGKSNSQGSKNASEKVLKVVELLNKLDTLIDETPPIQQPQRFGNVAFRTWFQKMRDASLYLLEDVLEEEKMRAIPEIVCYLVESFGNSTRIDYGTGHEIAFLMFLCCLFKIGVFKDSDKTATGCCIFPRYLDLARKLQKTYRMEPAGSHGVWSLDDYQFVPFIWGSSQLFAHPSIEPAHFLNLQVLNNFGQDFMFLTCIKYINSVKTGPFAEHSNQLWSISGVSSWTKINGGLIKMYKAEVLSKFPVIQHITFGSLFTLKPIEQCTGMMTPKFDFTPPPQPSPRSSASTLTSEDSSNEKKATSEHSSQQASVQYSGVSKTTEEEEEEEEKESKSIAGTINESEAPSTKVSSESSIEKESVRFNFAEGLPQARGRNVRAVIPGDELGKKH